MTLADGLVHPLSHHTLMIFLIQVGVLLLLALLLGRLAQRLGMPAIVGELTAGVLLGPTLLANLAPDVADWLFPQDPSQMYMLDAIAQIGVLLLVGFTGMHLDLRVVRKNGARAGGVAAAALLIPLGLGIWVGYLIPDSLRTADSDTLVFALFLGVAMAVSSIPVVARILIDMRLIHRNVGQMILVVGTIDDALGWMLVSVVAAMATTGIHAGQISASMLSLALVILLAMTVGRVIVRTAMRAASRSEIRGMPMTTAVILVILFSAGTQALELEAVFGAFICGILLGSCKDVDRPRLEPLNTTVLAVLAPLFFATAGLRVDLTVLAEPQVAYWAVVVLALAIAGKFLGAYAGAVFGRMNRWEALAVGAGINARGVVQIIIAFVGMRIGVLSIEMYSIIMLVAVITSVMAPPLLRIAARHLETTDEEHEREERTKAFQP